MFQLILKILFYLIIIGFNKNCLSITIKNGISSSSSPSSSTLSDIIKNNNNNNNLINSKTDRSNNKLIYSDIKYDNNSLFNNNNKNNINVNNVIENFIKPNINKKYILLQKPSATASTLTTTSKTTNINFFKNGNYISNRKINFDSKVLSLNKNNIVEKNTTTTTNKKLLDRFINKSSISNHIKLSHHSTSFNSKLFQLNKKFKRSTTSILNRKKQRHVRRDINRENLCINECKCTVVNNFLTVNCEFYESRLYIFGSTKYIPRQATSLVIKLAKHSQFRLDENFFHQNKINRIYVEGATDDSHELVEFGPNAFSGNSGPFPEINVINCHSVLLRSNAFNGEFKLNITNCKEVDIYSGAFYNTTFHGHLENIKDLRPFERAFTKATAKIDVINCHIHQLYRLDASLKELKFVHSSIHEITSGTFDVISINSIIFENCTIGRIMTGTATGRLFSSHLAIKGCNIDVIESDAIAGSGITEFIFENNNVSVINANAIDLTTIQATIAHNKINSLGYNWFHVHGWSHIIIKKNQFGNFNRLTVEKTSNPVECTFEENFITNADWQSLNFTSTYCKLKEISFFHPCTCNLEWLLNLTSVDIKSESYCTIDDTLKYCFNTSIINVGKYYQDICVTSEQTLDCMKKKVNKQIENNFIHPNDLNTDDNGNYSTRTLYILIGSIILAIAIILSSIIIVMCILKKKCNKNVSDTTSFEMSSTHEFTTSTFKNSQLQFSTADRLIINQTLENMKRKYSMDKYDQVYNNTKKLLHGHLSESEKVSTISEIIRNIRECSNSGDDFVAFNDILYRHLAPTTNAGTPPSTTTTTTTEMATAPTNHELLMEIQNSNDPVYEEPNLIQNHPNFIHINNRNNDHLPNYNLTNEPIIILDHIYNEPNNVQQPLLTNEYSAPIDRNEQFTLYSEPLQQAAVTQPRSPPALPPTKTTTINRDKSRNIISPYAISGNNHDYDENNQKSLHNNKSLSSSSSPNVDEQKPCSSKNLPDILNEQLKSPQLRSTVQKLSDTFSNINNSSNNSNNNNNKYLTQSPISNRYIPKYTIPNTKFKIRQSTSPPLNSDNINCLVSLGEESERVSQDTASDHSGGSDVTLPIDDRIDYADS